MGHSEVERSSPPIMETKLEQLPEGCISEILARTSPADACRSTILAKQFKAAADSDTVWERFLGLDYQEIISRSITPLPVFHSKKELYFSLCDQPILIDHGTKSFRLDKATGKKCYMVGARGLSIAWQDEPQYWAWISDPSSRFDVVASLNMVFWFDIKGHIETKILSPNTTYAAYLVFKFGPDDYGFRQLFKCFVTVVGHGEQEDVPDQTHFIEVNLKPRRPARRSGYNFFSYPQLVHDMQTRDHPFPSERADGWTEICMGDFTIPSHSEDNLVRMQVQEVEVLDSKSGIIIEGIEVRPK